MARVRITAGWPDSDAPSIAPIEPVSWDYMLKQIGQGAVCTRHSKPWPRQATSSLSSCPPCQSLTLLPGRWNSGAAPRSATSPRDSFMAIDSSDITGLRVLLVERHLLVADLLAAFVHRHGGIVVGPALDLISGLHYAEEAEFDGALLDVDLFGDFCFPIASVLTERKIPFLFLMGYDHIPLIPPEFHSARRLPKPVDSDSLCKAISMTFRNIGSHRAAVH